MQETKVYKRAYTLPGKPQTIYYTIKLSHGVHRCIWASDCGCSFEDSSVYRWLTTNEAIDPPSSLRFVTEELKGTLGTPEGPKATRGIVVIDCMPKRKRRKST